MLLAFFIGYIGSYIRDKGINCQGCRQKTGPSAGSEKSIEEHLVEERDIGGEEAAEQLVAFENEASIHGVDEKESLPTCDGRLSSQR